jgi:lipopolysaccharide export system ATP-binding protein
VCSHTVTHTDLLTTTERSTLTTLKTQGLVKTFNKLAVVNHVDMALNGGEIVGLLGPNGAGKTTCFDLICGLLRPDEGSIVLNDRNVTHLPMHQRARLGIGYLPQEPSIFRRLTVEENLLAVLEALPALTAQERQHRADKILANFGIAHKRDSKGATLSGGERRRVEIARAVVLKPLFMLLDEPFAGIDPISIGDIRNAITQLREAGIGVLITDHNVREALSICDRAYIIADGMVLADGSPDDILKNNSVRTRYLGQEFQL